MTADRPTELSAVITLDSVKTPLVQPKPQRLSDLYTHCRVFPSAYCVPSPVIRHCNKKEKKKKEEREDEAYLFKEVTT